MRAARYIVLLILCALLLVPGVKAAETIIIGEVLTLKKHYLRLMLIGIVLGSIAYRFLYMGVLYFTNQPQFMKLISAASIVIFILLGRLRPKKKPKKIKEAVPCQ